MRRTKTDLFKEIEELRARLGETTGPEQELPRLAGILLAVDDMLALVDRDFVYRYANKAYVDAFGKSEQEVVGNTVAEIFGEDFFDEVVRPRAEQCLAGSHINYQAWMDFPRRGRRYMDIAYRPYRSSTDDIWGFVVSARDLTDNKRVEAERDQLLQSTAERHKELKILYEISKLNQVEDISIEELCRRVVALVIPAWQFPESTCARITVGETSVQSENYADTAWKLSSDIVVHGKTLGSIEVCYLNEKPTADEGPFLKEERNLIDTLSRQFATLLERIHAREERLEAHRQLEESKRLLEYSNRELALLEHISRSFATHTDKMVYTSVLLSIVEDLRSEAGAFGYLDDQGNFVFPAVIWNIREGDNHPNQGIAFPEESWRNSLLGQVSTANRTICQNTAASLFPDGRFKVDRHVSVPVTYADEVIGIVIVANRFSAYSEADVARLEGVVGHIAPVMEARIKRDHYEANLEQTAATLNASNQQIRATEQQLRAANQELRATNQQLDASLQQLRATEHRLRASEEHLRMVLDATPFPVAIVDESAENVLFWSQSGLEKFGHVADTTEGWYEIAYPDPAYRAEVKSRFDSYVENAKNAEKALYAGEYHVTCRDGSVRICECYAAFVHDLLVVTFHDVTERKITEQAVLENEAKFRNYVNEAPYGIFVVDQTGRYVDVNPKACEITGYSSSELLKMDIPDLLSDQSMETGMAAFSELTNRGNVKQELPFVTQSGEERWFSLSGVKLDENRYLGFVEDVTGRRKGELERDALRNDLAHAQKMESIGRLAGGVAHDFNNMLSVILGSVEFALETLDKNHPAQSDLVEIREAAGRAAEVATQLLGFARKQPIAPRPLDLNKPLQGLLKILRRLIGENVELILHRDPELWPVFMDATQFDQIITNLCVNSRDAIEGTGTIQIKTENAVLDEDYIATHRTFFPGEYVTLTICDDGAGMDKETQEMIFEPFFTTKRAGTGTGMGLATVYGIIKQNNGFINVYSEPGQGSTFKIYLPRHVDDNSFIPDEKVDDSAEIGVETILVVEDEFSILKIARRILEQFGYSVLAASSPSEAIARAGEHAADIDLLLTDVVMPQMNGRQLLEELRKTRQDLKCIFMSGHAFDVITRQGILEEGSHFIQKPFTRRELAAIIKEALRRKRPQ